MNTLAPARGFGPAGEAAGGHAALPGHDFARVAVQAPGEGGEVVQRSRRNHTGLPDTLKAGIERLSGLPMDDVRVHRNSPMPARVQAAAYTRGTHIYTAPGQEQHLAHEAWHVVQQKQRRVRPTGGVAGLPLNDSEHLEREATEMGSKAAALPSAPATHAAAPAPGPAHTEVAASAPLQRWPDWWPSWLGGKKAPARRYAYGYGAIPSDHDEEEARQARQRETQNEHWRTGFNRQRVDEAVATPSAQKVQKLAKLGSGALSGVAKVGEALSTLHVTSGTEAGLGLGAAGSLLSVPASLISSGVAGKTMATGQDKYKDKALLGGQALSDLGSAATTSASGLMHGAKLAAGSSTLGPALGTAASVATRIAAPVAMAKGGIDIVRGGVQAGLAAHRRGKLKELQENIEKRSDNREMLGAARFAKHTQTTRTVRGIGTAVGGALALGGGIALLASNPIGWTLLGSAAVIGGGMAAYKRIREHRLGKKLASDAILSHQVNSENRLNAHIPTSEELAPKTKWEKVKNVLTANTEGVRRYNLMRGHLAEKLAEREDWGDTRTIVSNLGLKPRRLVDHDGETVRLADDDDAQRAKRVKNIARALEG